MTARARRDRAARRPDETPVNLGSTAADMATSTTAAFVGRVMTAVGSSPRPSAPRSFFAAARDRSLREALASLVVAAHLALLGRTVPRPVRARAFSLVVAVALMTGTGATLAATTAYQVAAPIIGLGTDVNGRGDIGDPSTPPTATPSPAPARQPAAVDPVPSASPVDEAPPADAGTGDADDDEVESGDDGESEDEDEADDDDDDAATDGPEDNEADDADDDETDEADHDVSDDDESESDDGDVDETETDDEPDDGDADETETDDESDDD